MGKILIIGAGAMGAAFSVPCIENNHKTILVGTHLDDNFIKYINENDNFHPSLKVKLSNKTKFINHSQLNDEINEIPDLIVIGTNSKGIEWSVNQISLICKENILPPIVLLTKGLSVHRNTYDLLVNKLERNLIGQGFKNINISAIGGPCLANDLANKSHSSVVIANKELKTAKWLQEILSTKYYHIFISNDLIGVEVCAAIKNIFSMIIGSAKGINNKDETHYLNTAASLFNQCLYEMEFFVKFLNGKKDTVYGLAGIGDLYVSAAGGRNSLMGSYLGKGYVYSEAKKIKMKDVTVEGAELAFEIYNLVRKDFKLKQLPLLLTMVDSIVNDKKIDIRWDLFN